MCLCASARVTLSADAWPQARSNGRSPATASIAAGAASHRPKQGLLFHAVPSGSGALSSAARVASAPRALHAMSSHTCATAGGRSLVAKSA